MGRGGDNIALPCNSLSWLLVRTINSDVFLLLPFLDLSKFGGGGGNTKAESTSPAEPLVEGVAGFGTGSKGKRRTPPTGACGVLLFGWHSSNGALFLRVFPGGCPVIFLQDRRTPLREKNPSWRFDFCPLRLLESSSTTQTALIVITFYSPSCIGQETAKGPFGFQVKRPPAHLSTTHDGGFTLSLLLFVERQAGKQWTLIFIAFGLIQQGIKLESNALVAALYLLHQWSVNFPGR